MGKDTIYKHKHTQKRERFLRALKGYNFPSQTLCLSMRKLSALTKIAYSSMERLLEDLKKRISQKMPSKNLATDRQRTLNRCLAAAKHTRSGHYRVMYGCFINISFTGGKTNNVIIQYWYVCIHFYIRIVHFIGNTGIT